MENQTLSIIAQPNTDSSANPREHSFPPRAGSLATTRPALQPTRAAEIPVRNGTLPAELSVPLGAVGIVLFAHDSGNSWHNGRSQKAAQAMQAAGIGTLLFDLLTEDEEAHEMQPQQLSSDVSLLANRLGEATFWLHRECDTWDKTIGYFGAGTGGAAALVAASKLGSDVGAIVISAGRPELAAAGILSRIKAPTLLIVGERDRAALNSNESALRQLRGKRELRVVPRAADLCEEPEALEKATQLAVDWFGRHLASNSLAKSF